MNSILDDCKLSPTLEENENILFSTYISLGNSIRSNVIIILTNFNLLRIKKTPLIGVRKMMSI